MDIKTSHTLLHLQDGHVSVPPPPPQWRLPLTVERSRCHVLSIVQVTSAPLYYSVRQEGPSLYMLLYPQAECQR